MAWPGLKGRHWLAPYCSGNTLLLPRHSAFWVPKESSKKSVTNHLFDATLGMRIHLYKLCRLVCFVDMVSCPLVSCSEKRFWGSSLVPPIKVKLLNKEKVTGLKPFLMPRNPAATAGKYQMWLPHELLAALHDKIWGKQVPATMTGGKLSATDLQRLSRFIQNWFKQSLQEGRCHQWHPRGCGDGLDQHIREGCWCSPLLWNHFFHFLVLHLNPCLGCSNGKQQ